MFDDQRFRVQKKCEKCCCGWMHFFNMHPNTPIFECTTCNFVEYVKECEINIEVEEPGIGYQIGRIIGEEMRKV